MSAIVTLMLITATVPAVTFVTMYLLEYRHVKPTPESRHLIGFTLVVALILLEELLRRSQFRDIISDETHRVFLVIMIPAAAVFLWQRLYMLLRYQIVPRHQRRRTRQKINP